MLGERYCTAFPLSIAVNFRLTDRKTYLLRAAISKSTDKLVDFFARQLAALEGRLEEKIAAAEQRLTKLIEARSVTPNPRRKMVLPIETYDQLRDFERKLKTDVSFDAELVCLALQNYVRPCRHPIWRHSAPSLLNLVYITCLMHFSPGDSHSRYPTPVEASHLLLKIQLFIKE